MTTKPGIQNNERGNCFGRCPKNNLKKTEESRNVMSSYEYSENIQIDSMLKIYMGIKKYGSKRCKKRLSQI